MQPIEISTSDDELTALRGASFPSQTAAASYQLLRPLGEGGMAIAFFALRVAAEGQTPVVVKVLRPSLVAGAGARAALMVQKECVALGRLNEQVPPTPFVVRLVDTGTVPVAWGRHVLDLPWIAVEHVHGGAEGTTLDDRVRQSVARTRYAFDQDRAALAIAAIARGVGAVHSVGVIHRDLTPANVLCCGFGEDEIFKIADFGIARPEGMAATFGGLVIGTPGYAPPEQFLLDTARVGPWSDVFSLAAVIYFLLTGDEYLPCSSAAEALMVSRRPERPRLADAAALAPELRARPSVCAVIDAALARATSVEPERRPDQAEVLARMIVPVLRPDSGRTRTAARRLRSLGDEPTLIGGWSFTPRRLPDPDVVVLGVAWDSDGKCLAATDRGLAFWTGTSWVPAPVEGVDVAAIRAVRRMAAGTWLVAGDGALVGVYTGEGAVRTLSGADSSLRFEQASGDVDDLAVFVATRDGAPVLYGMAGGRWLKPATIIKAQSVAGLARIGDSTWLVAGRTKDGEGFVARYEPLLWEVRRLPTSSTRAYLSVAGRPEVELGVVVGTGGRTVRVDAGSTYVAVVDGEPQLSAVALDVTGRAWAGAAGGLWMQTPDAPARWSQVWRDESWTAPFVSVMADVGLVVAVTADGGIVEGRMQTGAG